MAIVAINFHHLISKHKKSTWNAYRVWILTVSVQSKVMQQVLKQEHNRYHIVNLFIKKLRVIINVTYGSTCMDDGKDEVPDNSKKSLSSSSSAS